ncbi:MAG: Asp23/Gls24 family envelope stress response protein [Veillonella sp.]|uniref:Asp23/Gls24 family envelope stress response protein n=1 Tax=Veillonella sp. TaxID=1926307 RepID=UPI0025DD7DEB|nr:Asp23/Gls24 family envelope stress response protein [Veillonella sp.]MBE6080461.1 Asp23/Gls24 family envelope stress response protein [Veillonella sp.]
MDVKSNNPQLQVDVSDEVLLQIAHHALTLIPGYHSLNSNFYTGMVDGIARNFGQKRLPGINVKHRKEGLEINIYINVLYGYPLMTMAAQIRQQINKDLKESLNLDSVRIDVHFENIIDPNQVTEELNNEAKS